MKKLFTVLMMAMFLAVAGPVAADEAVVSDTAANENASEQGQQMSKEKKAKKKGKKNKKKRNKKNKKSKKSKKPKKAAQEAPAADEALSVDPASAPAE